MRQKSQLVVGEQTRVDLRLIGEDVETSRAKLPTLEGTEKRLFVDDTSASGVDEYATLLHGVELLLAEKSTGVGVEGEVERDDIRGSEELVEGGDVGNGAFGLRQDIYSQCMIVSKPQVNANSRSQREAKGRQGYGCKKTTVSFNNSISII